MYHIVETDVVIVGAGAAGTFAALHAHKADPLLRIAVLDKSKMETSGAAGRGMDALNTMALPPYSTPEDVVEMLTKISEGVLDQEVAYAFGERCPEAVRELEEIMNRPKGDLFPVDENGNYRLWYLHPTNKPMLLPMHGEEMKRALAFAVRKTGVMVYDRTPVIKLVVQDGRIAGVLGYNIRNGEYWYFKTKAVCLTTGCAGRLGMSPSGYLSGLYEFPGNSGDGFVLAYEAGAELANMEYIQGSTKIKDHEGPACAYVAAPRGAYTVDRNGDRIDCNGWASGDSRLVMWKTYAEGRGPVYLKINHLSEDMVKIIEKVQFGSERTSRGMFHERRGYSYHDEKAVELHFDEAVGSCGGHGLSGVLADKDGATRVPGLYVAGDIDAGLPQSYLGGAFVMGIIIGEKAAEFARNVPQIEVPGLKAWIKREQDRFEAPLHRAKGLPTNMVEYKARTRIQQYIKPPKNPEYLERAAWWMRRIREQDLPEITAVDFHDLMKVHEIENILLVGEMLAESSLRRTESRWGYHHWRLDMPDKDPAWDYQWLIVRKNDDGSMGFERRRVPEAKWKFQDWMDYEYPVMKYETGKQFKRDPNLKNPPGDPWMKAHLDKEGLDTPRRFMPTHTGEGD